MTGHTSGVLCSNLLVPCAAFKNADGQYLLTLTKTVGLLPSELQRARLVAMVKNKLQLDSQDVIRSRNQKTTEGELLLDEGLIGVVEGGWGLWGLDDTQVGVVADNYGALAKVGLRWTLEAGRDASEMPAVVKANERNKVFWKEVLKEGGLTAIECNSRAWSVRSVMIAQDLMSVFSSRSLESRASMFVCIPKVSPW